MRMQIDAIEFSQSRLFQTAQMSFHDNLEAQPGQFGDLIKEGIQRKNLVFMCGPLVGMRHLDHEQQAERIVL
jgi:hypothetical protein